MDVGFYLSFNSEAQQKKSEETVRPKASRSCFSMARVRLYREDRSLRSRGGGFKLFLVAELIFPKTHRLPVLYSKS